eukprot:gene9803-2128_t
MNNKTILNLVYKIFWFLSAGSIGFYFFKRWFGQKREPTKFNPLNGPSFTGDMFESPFLDDDEELRLKPVSVNSFVYVLPTMENDDGIFVKLLIENTSELATESV